VDHGDCTRASYRIRRATNDSGAVSSACPSQSTPQQTHATAEQPPQLHCHQPDTLHAPSLNSGSSPRQIRAERDHYARSFVHALRKSLRGLARHLNGGKGPCRPLKTHLSTFVERCVVKRSFGCEREHERQAVVGWRGCGGRKAPLVPFFFVLLVE
jgi:hypothetical protein